MAELKQELKLKLSLPDKIRKVGSIFTRNTPRLNAKEFDEQYHTPPLDGYWANVPPSKK